MSFSEGQSEIWKNCKRLVSKNLSQMIEFNLSFYINNVIPIQQAINYPVNRPTNQLSSATGGRRDRLLRP